MTEKTLSKTVAAAPQTRGNEALRASEDRFHGILETIEEGYYEVDLAGNVLLSNTAFCRMLGYTAAELAGRNNRHFQTAEAAASVFQTFSDVHRTGVPAKHRDWGLLRKDGTSVVVEGSIHLVRDQEGAATGFRGFLRDVTLQRRTEQALRNSESKYRSILETIEDAYYEVDIAGVIVLCNGAFCRMLGYRMDEIIGASYRAYQTAQSAARVFAVFNQVFRTGVPTQSFDWEMLRKDGSSVTGEGSVQAVRNAQGDVTGFRGILRDVTERRRVDQALRDSEAKYRGILETIEDAYYEVDRKGVIVLCNGAFSRLIGYETEKIIGSSFTRFQMPDKVAQVFTVFNQVFRTGVATQRFDWEMVRKDGSSATCEGSVQLVRCASGEACGFRGILRDVTDRRAVEQALRDSESRFRALTNLSTDWYWEQDAEFRYTRMESRHDGAGSTQSTFVGKRPWETELEIEGEGGWDAHRASLAARRSFRDVSMFRLLPGGRPYYISISGEPFFAADGRFDGYRGVSREITDQRLAEERIHHLATHDALTELPNRAMFSQLLCAAIRNAQRQQGRFAVLFIDLDRFKSINDTLGHEAGDCLLKEITARFKRSLRSGDVIARLGGDEFVVLLQDVDNGDRAATVARKLLSTAIRPVILTGRECRVTCSIGVAMYPHDGGDELTLMKNADIAMYFAKEEGKNNFQFYSDQIKSLSLERLMLENHLRRALERDEFSLHYQAKLNLARGVISGVEALLRWNNLELGSVPPNTFIPVAEETGMIIQIGKWVLKTACEQNMAWQRAGLPPVCMAVNLSVRQFSDERLLKDIASILRETGMPAHLLELEITEGMVIGNPGHASQVLASIKKMGVRLAIDDFGTGYSSLGQLKNFPLDTLKIDRSFIRDLADNPEDRAITEAIIAMGKTLRLTVVAEGVETVEQEDFLRKHACDETQGYYFSRPVPAAEFAALLSAHKPGRRSDLERST